MNLEQKVQAFKLLTSTNWETISTGDLYVSAFIKAVDAPKHVVGEYGVRWNGYMWIEITRNIFRDGTLNSNLWREI